MNLYELTKKEAKLEKELQKIAKRIADYNKKIEDLIKRKTEDKKFHTLTKDEWNSIELYNDWSYYEVKKEIL